MATAPPLPPGYTQDEVDKKFAQLNEQAEAHKVEWMQRQVPPELQATFEYMMSQQPPTELPADSVIVANNDSVRVVSELGSDVPGSPGKASVLNGNLDFVQINSGRR
jgi:hypothetical protein